MPAIRVNTDALQHAADTFATYGDDVQRQTNQLLSAWQELPDHWQGSAAQRAYHDLEGLISHLSALCERADNLRAGLLKAKQLFEQANMDGLNGLSLGRQEWTWVPRSYAGGDQGALTGGQLYLEDEFSYVSRFVSDQGPPPLSDGQNPLGATSQVADVVSQFLK
jgi:WXG100 family type VII secretion target